MKRTQKKPMIRNIKSGMLTYSPLYPNLKLAGASATVGSKLELGGAGSKRLQGKGPAGRAIKKFFTDTHLLSNLGNVILPAVGGFVGSFAGPGIGTALGVATGASAAQGLRSLGLGHASKGKHAIHSRLRGKGQSTVFNNVSNLSSKASF